MSDFSEFISSRRDREETRAESVYYVQHRNKRSVLDQELVITEDLALRTYKVSMEMKDFPKCGSEREVVLKLVEWMQRMATVIENYWSEPQRLTYAKKHAAENARYVSTAYAMAILELQFWYITGWLEFAELG